jgi:soluble lytic murein transglycosylase
MTSMLKTTILISTLFFSCSHAQLLGFTKVKDMSCDELAKASSDKNFALNNLAGIRGLKKCPNFGFDPKTVGGIERRIFLQELGELSTTATDSTQAAPFVQTEIENIQSLKKSIKLEKNILEKMQLMKQLRSKLRSAGKKPEAFKVLRDLHVLALKSWQKDKKNFKLQEMYVDAATLYGRQLWADNEHKKSQSILTAAIQNLGKDQTHIDLHFVLGRVYEETEKYKEAVAQYDLILEELKKLTVKSATLTREKLLWVRAWAIYKSEEWALAAAGFKTLADETTDTAEKSRARFFLARSLTRIDQADEAKKIWTLMTQEDFYSYYSLLAHDELGIKVPPFKALKPTEKFKFDSELSFLDRRQKDLFMSLLQHDEVDLAERAAQMMADKPEQLTILGLELARRGQRFLPLFVAFAKLPVEQKLDVFVEKSSLLFPRLFQNEVNEMAEKTGLPKSLIYSIMRQESAFNINSRSPANALGLMQVIPPLAKQLARKHKVDYKKAEDLYNPQINIKLGSLELSEQVRRQKDQYAFVAMAYNAGPTALSRWLKTRWRPQFDVVDFVEEIPFDETKLYVKVIARNHLFYDRLENPDKEFGFPEKFIKKSEALSQN